MDIAMYEKVKRDLEELKKEEIRICYEENQGKELEVGVSRIGGCPDLPADFVWPRYKGEAFDGVDKERPLTFMAQINLKDVAAYDKTGLLPKAGILSFFYDCMTMKWGFSPEDKGCARVYYFSEEVSLHRTNVPEDLEGDARISECRITFEESISLPEFEDYKRLKPETISGWEEYDETRTKLGYESDGWGDRTKLLGYADVIQNSMEEECEILSRGYGTGSPEEYAKIPTEERADIREKSRDWLLLFQMGTISTYASEMMFGDCGHIYFWIRKQDLAEQKFDRTWLILQCS